MSFLSGIIGKVTKFVRSNSFVANAAKTALLAFVVRKLYNSANKDNEKGDEVTPNIDNGVRLQVKPNTQSKIPVLYGSAYFGGNISDAALTNSNKTMWYSIVLTEKTGDLYSTSSASAYTLNNVYWNDLRLVFQSDGITVDYAVDRQGTIDRNLSGLVKVYFYAGGRTAGQVPSGYTGSVPNAETLFPNWTAGTHAMTDLVFALVRVDYNREKGVTGIGNMLWNITNTMNLPGDVVYDYLTDTTYGAGIAAGDVLTTDITALNTYSAQGVNYEDEGTGVETLADRYQINGLLDTQQDVFSNVEKVLSSAASWLSYDNHEGKWGVVINKAETSVASFSDDNILGSVELNGTGLAELYNSVKVEFPHRDLRDSADFVKIEIPSGDRNSNEEDNTLNISYDIINEPVQAQLLGFIELKQSRIDKVIRFQADYSYYNLKAGDVIDITNDRFSFSSKLFRIITISEIQEEEGGLIMDITALEYDSNVYSTADLYRYTRTDSNGIISFGAIGQPGTPVVTKYESASRPRIDVTTTSPTGIVEGIEYWITFDTAEADDANRSYTLIATKKPVGGGVYTSGTNVTLDYDNLGASNFYIKTRGFNTNTVGPYSAPSGLVEYVPVQTTDAIGIDTQAFDETGGLLGTLGLVEMLIKLYELFGSGNDGKSIFERIFDIFEDETGVDIVGDAADGSLVVDAAIETKKDGTTVSATTSSYDFISPLDASGASDITVKITDGATNKDILAWNAEDSEWQLISGCISCDFPEIIPPGIAVPCSLEINSTLPASSGGIGNLCKIETDVPFTGSYFIQFEINPGNLAGTSIKSTNLTAGVDYIITKVGTTDFTAIGASANTIGVRFTATASASGSGYAATIGSQNSAIPLYAPLQLGTGNIYLYGTDGVIEQTLTTSDVVIKNDVLELPFANRLPGKDYYILIDEGFVTSCSCENSEINDSLTWAFTTALTRRDPYEIISPTALTPYNPSGVTTVELRATGISPVGTQNCVGDELAITFTENIVAGTGVVTIKVRSTGATATTLNISSASISGNTATWNPVSGLLNNTEYDVDIPAGLVTTDRTTTASVCDVTVNLDVEDIPNIAGNFGFKTGVLLQYVRADFCYSGSGNVEVDSNIDIYFNKNIVAKTTGPAYVTIYESGGSVHQKIDLKGTFTSNKYGAIYNITGNKLTLNPTVPFKPGKSYYLNIDLGAILDAECLVAFSGITDSTTIPWQVDGIETTSPLFPIFGSILVDIEFDRPVVPGYGKINVITTDGELITQVSSNDWTVKFQKNEPFSG